jgi:hypothetical protein
MKKGTSGKKAQGQVEITSQGSERLTFIHIKQASYIGHPETNIQGNRQSIAIVTPLQFTKGNPNARWIFNEELTPISVEELPPNEFFFDKEKKGHGEARIISKRGHNG